MKESSFRDILINSAVELGFGADLFLPLDDVEGAKIALLVENQFGDAANGGMAGWWYSNLPCPLPKLTRFFPEGGWRHLISVVEARNTAVWLIAENSWRGDPRYFIFSSTVEVVHDVLGNNPGFEYIIADQHLNWLFAEDHEDCVSVAGFEVMRKLKAIEP